MDQQEEGSYTEESYYEEETYEEEEDVEEIVEMPPSARPAHPLFAGAAAKSAIAAAAANMNQKRATNPSEDPRPSRAVAAAPASHSQPTPPPNRPAHPLFGGGSGGGGSKDALHEQIKAMAAKRNDRVAKEGGGVPSPEPKPKKSIEAVMPAGNRPAGAQTASLADQIAMRAAQRSDRLSGGAASPAPESAAPPRPLRPTPTPAEPAAPPPTKIVTRTVKTGPTTTTTSKVVKRQAPSNNTVPSSQPVAAPTTNVPVKPSAPAPKKEKPHTFQTAQLKNSSQSEPKPVASADKPSFLKTPLKPTGVQLDLAPPEPEYSEPPPPKTSSPPAATEGPRVVYEKAAVPAPPPQTIKRVTKSDPTFEVVEYKCMCTIM